VDRNSVLKMAIASSLQGIRLNWNAQPGFIYQVQIATQLGQWSNFGAPRLAATNTDSVAVDAAPTGAFYRVLRVR
jgi:hypothetical protein